jgi:hypothetical protein
MSAKSALDGKEFGPLGTVIRPVQIGLQMAMRPSAFSGRFQLGYTCFLVSIRNQGRSGAKRKMCVSHFIYAYQ